MASRVTYHPGGFLPNAPQQNRAYLLDGAAGVYVAWDEQGTETARRALTANEASALAQQDAAVAAVTNADDLRTKLRGALGVNRTYLGVGAPTAAQTTAQVKALTRQILGIELLLLDQLDDTTGT